MKRAAAAVLLLEAYRGSEEAAPRAIRALATPILSVGAGDGLLIGHGLLGLQEDIAGRADLHGSCRDDEAVIDAAAPFTVFRSAKSALGNPAVMSKGRRCCEETCNQDERHTETQSDHGANHIVVSRGCGVALDGFACAGR
jgi:hypothetical protein